MPHRLQRESWIKRLGGLAASAGVRGWMSTLDLQMTARDPTVDPADPGFRGPVIAIFWHEYLLCPFATRGNTNTAILTSRHRDADWLSESARHLGFQTVRGSSGRGGGTALLELLRANSERNWGISPDGPRGPRRSLALGPVYLASKLGRPIIPLGVGYDRPWRMNTWDRFAVPRPGSRVRVIWGDPIEVPPDLTRSQLLAMRQEVQDRLVGVTEQAENWAAGRFRYPDQRPMHMQPVPRRTHATHLADPVPPPKIRWRNPTEMPPRSRSGR